MSINIGGTLGVLAFVGLVALIGYHRTPTSPKVTERVQTVPVAVPAKSTPKPVKPAATKPTKAPAAKVKVRKVLPGGKLDGTVDCSGVKSFAEGKSAAQLAVAAAQYHVTPAEIAKYKTCMK